MPELPEVERAVRAIRSRVDGRAIAEVRVLHPALARRLPPRHRRALRGDRIIGVDRRGKHQLFRLQSGRTLHVHFRMTGWWQFGRPRDALPEHARAVIAFRDGTWLAFEDPRALGSIALYERDVEPSLGLGPEPFDRALTPARFRMLLAPRRTPIKPALLDQRMIAGLGNIYAAEALWRARISPFAESSRLSMARVSRLLAAVRAVLRGASGARHLDAEQRFAVYDRLGRPCRRCGAAIQSVGQAGRTTYYCPRCQSR